MTRYAMIAAIFICGLAGGGCSEPASKPPEEIKGMSPGEYRDKADLGKAVGAQGPEKRGHTSLTGDGE